MKKLDKAIIWPVYFDIAKPEKDDEEYQRIFLCSRLKSMKTNLAVID